MRTVKQKILLKKKENLLTFFGVCNRNNWMGTVILRHWNNIFPFLSVSIKHPFRMFEVFLKCCLIIRTIRHFSSFPYYPQKALQSYKMINLTSFLAAVDRMHDSVFSSEFQIHPYKSTKWCACAEVFLEKSPRNLYIFYFFQVFFKTKVKLKNCFLHLKK